VTVLLLAVFGAAVGIPLLNQIKKNLPKSVNLQLGQRANLSSSEDKGVVGITVEKVIFPTKLAQPFFTPTPGKRYAVAQIKECGGARFNSDNAGSGLDWFDWALVGSGASDTAFPIDQRYPAIDKAGETNGVSNDLTNRCVTGWLTFQFPQKVNPTWIRYTGQYRSTFSWYLARQRHKR
jgi:hypothetical protein